MTLAAADAIKRNENDALVAAYWAREKCLPGCAAKSRGVQRIQKPLITVCTR
jgi:hypothetical protein